MKLRRIVFKTYVVYSLLFFFIIKLSCCQIYASGQESYDEFISRWNQSKDDLSYVLLTPGGDEHSVNLAWYSNLETSKLQVGVLKNKKDAVEEKTLQGNLVIKLYKGKPYYAYKARILDLEPGNYYYQIDEKKIGNFTISDSKTFSFIAVGDSQIGSSNEKKGRKDESFYIAQEEAVRKDAYQWETTLVQALKKAPNARFLLSMGDQIQTSLAKAPNKEDPTISEVEYRGYAMPESLKSLLVAPCVGNHDADNPNYLSHFNLPNRSELGSNQVTGGDYYFTYGDALFMVLNTQQTSIEEHREFIEQTIAEHTEEKWRIVSMHQDIYGAGYHAESKEMLLLREQMSEIFDSNDIDVVFSGHDHVYTRSCLLQEDKKAMDKIDVLKVTSKNLAKLQDNIEREEAINPRGTLYMTLNSSTGSKYYELQEDTPWYAQAIWQEKVPTYSIVSITGSTFTITTYRTDTQKPIDITFTIRKTTKPWVKQENIWNYFEQHYKSTLQLKQAKDVWYYH